MAVARAAGRLRPLVAGAVEEGGDLLVHAALDDELGAQPSQLGELIDLPRSLAQQNLDGSLNPLAGRYPYLGHGVVLLGELVALPRRLRRSLFHHFADATAQGLDQDTFSLREPSGQGQYSRGVRRQGQRSHLLASEVLVGSTESDRNRVR